MEGLHVIDTGDIDVFLGLDVGRGEHQLTDLVTGSGRLLVELRPR
ncbi:hypothetical protein [Streptomyces sp. NPDC057403]